MGRREGYIIIDHYNYTILLLFFKANETCGIGSIHRYIMPQIIVGLHVTWLQGLKPPLKAMLIDRSCL